MQIRVLRENDRKSYEKAKKERSESARFHLQIQVKPGVDFSPVNRKFFPTLRSSCQVENTAHGWGKIDTLDALEKYDGTDIVSVFVTRVIR